MAIGRPLSLGNQIAAKTVSITATAGQTSFTPSGGYNVSHIQVYRNGVQLVDGQDFNATDGATVVLTSAATADDVLSVEIWSTFNAADAVLTSGDSTIAGDLRISGNLDVTGITTGGMIGIQSGGNLISANARTLNFVGTGNTFLYRAGSKSVDVSIAGGGGGGGLGTAIDYTAGAESGSASPFSYIDKYATVSANLNLDNTVAGASTAYVVSVIPNITVANGIAVTVGTGKTMVIDVLQIGER